MVKQWRILVDAVMNFRVAQNAGNFLTGPATIDFSSRVVLCQLRRYCAQQLHFIVLYIPSGTPVVTTYFTSGERHVIIDVQQMFN